MNRNLIVRTLTFLTLSVFFSQSLEAARLTPQEALDRARQTSSRRIVSAGSSYELSFTGRSGGEETLYVFNKGENGFVVLPADDRMPAILGYSDNGAFDPANASPELKWWLSQYSDEAAYFFGNEDQFNSGMATTRRASRSKIAPLVTTKWNQSAPFNDDCPVVSGGRAVTGCVATAMAQVINYFKYPATGTGSHSYNYNGYTFSFNFGSTSFDWANMLDVYDGSANAQQKAAVATLMHGCGVSVNMNYTAYESGTSDLYVSHALKTYFGFDQGARYVVREYYTTEEWEDLIYGELAANRPVIYGGQAPTGGHEFVCDGYEDGYFHINWGWGGLNDGMFLLSALDPGADQGIGSFQGGYNSDQSATIGVQSTPSGAAPWYPIYAKGSLEKPKPNGGYLMCMVSIYNNSPEEATVEFCLKAVSQTNPGEEYFSATGPATDFPGTSRTSSGQTSSNGYGGFNSGKFSNIPAGTYKVYPYFKTPEGNFQKLLIPVAETGFFEMTVDGNGNISYGEGEPEIEAEIKVTKFAATGTVESGVETRFDVSIENIGDVEYSGDLSARAFVKGSEEKLAENVIGGLGVAPGQTLNGSVNLAWSLPDGEYDLICFDKYDKAVSATFPLYIGMEAPAQPTSITLDRSVAVITEGETLTLVATVLPETANDKSVIWASSNEEVATVDGGIVTALKPGEATITAVTSNHLQATCTVTVKAKIIEPTGISLDKTEASIVEGQTLTLTATIDPEMATDKTVIWSTSDEEVATVEEGVVTAVKAGQAVITAKTSNGLSATCNVTVTAQVIEPTGISLDKTEASIVEGQTLTLTATIDPEMATDKTVIWSSSDEEVATVEEGVVTAVKVGQAVITAKTSNGLSATCNVTVTAQV
ncbi:MAG: C10 family peptidase, partial [Duncaniella sp.]|nr:C10 family peptidase [Duncaniella sp.]